MEVKAEDVLARAFDSEEFNPFSSPLDAARFLLAALKHEGFTVERKPADEGSH